MKKYSKEWFKNQNAKHEGFDMVMVLAVSLIILIMIFGHE